LYNIYIFIGGSFKAAVSCSGCWKINVRGNGEGVYGSTNCI